MRKPTGTVELAGHSARAPAKINLYLHVTGRRSDGYHLLDSLVAFADFGDEVHAAPAADLTLAIVGPYGPALKPDESNLVLRAGRALAAECGVSDGAAITLTKNLPVAAGIGGGSADAAAALNVLFALWDIAPDEETMARLAIGLGADVPVCRYGKTAYMSGIGEEIRAAPALPPCGVVLANPNRPLSTADVFNARRGPFSGPAPFGSGAKTAAELGQQLAQRTNDLAPAAIELMPEIGIVLDALRGAAGCRLARLSGSGPTCFGLFDTVQAAGAAVVELSAAHPGWWIRATRFSDRAD